MENFKIDTSTMIPTIDIIELPPSCVLVIYDRKVKLRELPPHGGYKIVKHQGKVKGKRGKSFE